MAKASLVTIWSPVKTEYRTDEGHLVATANYENGWVFQEDGPEQFIGRKEVSCLETCEWLALAVYSEIIASWN